MRMSRLTVVFTGAALAAVFLLSRTGASQPAPLKQAPPVAARPASPTAAAIVAKQGASIALQTPALQTFTDVKGQMVGAGTNVVALLGEDGKAARQFTTGIARPSITPHGPNAILIGNLDTKAISTLDLKTGALVPLLKLSDVKDPAASSVPGGHLLAGGVLASVGSDGANVFIAVDAGFSSAIFKVDPATKQIVDRAWATAADPQAMVFHNGGLFVLVANGTQVRRFTEKLERSRDNIELPSQSKGLGIRSGELRVLNVAGAQVQRVTVDDAELTRASIGKNIDRPVAVQGPARALKVKALNVAKRYAVLITGDLAENFSGECFWNDTVWMYKSLLANGYEPEDIFVLYGDGADFVSANPAYKHPTKVTDFAATVGNVNAVLDGLKNGDAGRGIPKMDQNDSLFLWTFDHGGRTSSGEATLCLRNGVIGADAFAAKLNAIEYSRRAVFMQQCYSGGFINPLKNAKTFISTAAKADEVARPADTENEMVGGKTYSHGEFNYHITTALNRLAPGGAGINADGNSDAWVSSLEMHAWNVAKESRPETPQSNDMGGVGSVFKFKK
ncbi:MAG TPA: C13 family peptidase [Labilithrix sp.]|nr:C13 family peptidase [Labilithrix sp.]